MYCSNCGYEIKEGVFCSNCGKQMNTQNTDMQFGNDVGVGQQREEYDAYDLNEPFVIKSNKNKSIVAVIIVLCLVNFLQLFFLPYVTITGKGAMLSSLDNSDLTMLGTMEIVYKKTKMDAEESSKTDKPFSTYDCALALVTGAAVVLGALLLLGEYLSEYKNNTKKYKAHLGVGVGLIGINILCLYFVNKFVLVNSWGIAVAKGSIGFYIFIILNIAIMILSYEYGRKQG
ncbi:MAG: zinc ribbon domain-containing protein [Firmicutes bacterium]|nr:zinc ribbon domain-containing protein [Bacillota bacterium]